MFLKKTKSERLQFNTVPNITASLHHYMTISLILYHTYGVLSGSNLYPTGCPTLSFLNPEFALWVLSLSVAEVKWNDGMNNS